MRNGYMTAEVTFGQYTLELTGPDAKIWVGPGEADYQGPIDGIEQKYPDLWKHLIENKFIKLVEMK